MQFKLMFLGVESALLLLFARATKDMKKNISGSFYTSHSFVRVVRKAGVG